MIKRTTLSLLMGLTLSLPALSSAALQNDSSPIDLYEAVNLALNNAPEWRGLQKDIAAQQESVAQARSRLLPSVGLTAQTAKTDGESSIESTVIDTTEGNVHSLEIAISQPLIQFDAWFSYQAEKRNSERLDHQLNASYQAFIVDVADAYLDVLRANAEYTFAEAELSAIRQQLEQAKQRFRVGLIAITDVHEAQAVNDLAEVNKIAAATQLDITFENLGRLTGTTVRLVQPIKKNLPIANPTPNDMAQWVSMAEEDNPNVLAAKTAKSAAKQALKSARSLYLPEINLFASRTDSGSLDIDSEDTTIGVELSVPLFQGFRTYSFNKQSSLEYLSSQDSLVAEIRSTQQNTRNLFRSVLTDVLRVSARQQAIKSSTSALDATEAGYEVGTRNVIDVLNAQRSLFAAKRDYEGARYDFIINSLRLKQAAGKVNADEIKALNQWVGQ